MDERARADALIERLVRESGIGSARGQDELRRELRATSTRRATHPRRWRS